MKNLRFFLPIIVALIGVVFFTQCKKDHSCKMRVTCKYSSNGIDADSVVSFAIITFDTNKYYNGAVDTLISRLNVKDITEWTNDSLYRWCDEGKGYILYRIDNSGKHPYKYDGVANEDGVFEYTLPYPALLLVNAIKVEAVKDTSGNILEYVKYTGTAQVQVNEGETTDKTILMVETN